MKENQDCHEVSSSGSNNNDNNNKQFTLEEETMIYQKQTYCNFPKPLGQQDSLASWGKDIMNSDGNHIQAIIDNHSHNHYQILHGGSHLYGDSDVEVVKYAQQQQQQGMVLSSQQTTVDSNHENGCDLTREYQQHRQLLPGDISLRFSRAR